ncbi:MAG TPA: acetyl-CoA carboxylase biotin carboxyl carrier protein subunit [Polyangiaceae bacterium]|nr:acetyl-CoA carboxylase biotin carboxyl carrier protein subunit [Polyangiaceae bacterium]
MPLEVCAHITGTVWKVEVAAGDRVSAEQTLVILESMKMEMPLEAPVAGTVLEITVVPGASVDEGDVLLRLEPDA